MTLRPVAAALLLASTLTRFAFADNPVKYSSTLVTTDVAEAYRQDAGMKALALHGDARPFCAAVGNAPAEAWVEKPDDWFWDIMPSTTVQRVVTVGNDPFRTPKLGCPVHGSEIYSVDAYYPWIVDCVESPYKLKCPIGGETYPSNDYAAGDLTSGAFPDDGNGYLTDDGTRYHFIGLYAHYAYNTVLQPAIKSFGRAYTITGDRRYAHKAAICLLKEAYEYPDGKFHPERTYIPGYAQGSGMITDVVWSSGALVRSATCYDEIVAGIEGDEELVAFARPRIGIAFIDDIKLYIEARLLRPGIQAIIDRCIQPNAGWGSEAMATLALVMNDFGETRPNANDALEWLYYDAGKLKTVGNQFLRDGSSFESTSYNSARQGFMRAGEHVEKLRELAPGKIDPARFPNICRNEKLLRHYDTYTPGIKALGGAFTIAIGDVGSPACIERTPRRTGTPAPSQFLDGYGLAVLRSGEGAAQRDVTLFYGGLRGHAHYDPLMLGMHGFGQDLLPNIGYPQSWNFAPAWEWSLLTHNTVVVDRDEQPCSTVVGSLTLWAPMDGCQIVEASKRPYRRHEPRGLTGPDVTDYRRMTALIDVSETVWYAVDIFRVTGGQDHLQSWHGAYTPHPVKVEGVALRAQAEGTLAGENVEYGQRYTDAKGNERWDPYCFLRDVAHGAMADSASVDLSYDTEDDVHVRLAFLSGGDGPAQLLTARGGAPIAPDKDVLQWIFPHRSGEEGLRSQFITVIEPYCREGTLGAIERLPVQFASPGGYAPVAFAITVPGGRDIVLSNGDESGALEGEGFRLAGKLGFVRERAGQVDEMYLAGGTELSFGDASLCLQSTMPPARITEVDRTDRSIVIAAVVSNPEDLTGRRAIIDNHGERLSSYTIVDARAIERGRLRLTLDSSGSLGEGVAHGFEDGIIRNGPKINMPFAGLCEIDGELDYSDCFYFGGHLETGKPGVDYRVRGVMGFPYQAWAHLHEPGRNHVYLCDPVPAAELEAAIGDGTDWTIYEYGVGDEVSFDSYGYWSRKEDDQ